MPFGSSNNAFSNAGTLGYLSSEQALADFAEIILYTKANLSAQSCPVIVIGGSYSGMLASWFRLKYPHISIGALASSAPILYFDGVGPADGYYGVISKVFKEKSISCHNTIKESWLKIDEIAKQPHGPMVLSQKFKTCAPLNTSANLKDYLASLYAGIAQYDNFEELLVSKICNAIDGAPKGARILDRVFAGVTVANGNRSCLNTTEFDIAYQDGWGWQTCTEIIMPIGFGNSSTMFQYSPYNLTEVSRLCMKEYGVKPMPHWATTEFGGKDIKKVLAKFGSNIVFSNGLKDPYSSGGVLEKISDSIVALNTAEGPHCMDMSFSFLSEDNPEWLLRQQAVEMEIIRGWIVDYYRDTV